MDTAHFHLAPEDEHKSLQAQVQNAVLAAIADGYVLPGDRLPSPRQLGRNLGVSRNTVMSAYRVLVDAGTVSSRERQGYFVNEARARSDDSQGTSPNPVQTEAIDWNERLTISMEGQRNIIKSRNWQSFTYPFITGQLDPSLFPVDQWQQCCRHVIRSTNTLDWAADHFDTDTMTLVDQLRSRILPRRGIHAAPEEILVTMGAQHALYILSSLLMWGKCIGMEEPGYPDARNIFSMKSRKLLPLPVDEHGLVVGDHLAECDYVYVTPSHQAPTTVTLSRQRRIELLEAARELDFIIVEDDYDSETNFIGSPTPALRSMDGHERVIYVGSLSKTLAPGLRLGYLVASEELIHEARSLRRLMLRHAPGNNESALALFIARGHHDALVKQLRRHYQQRWHVMREALKQYLPGLETPSNQGGTAFWLKGPPALDCRKLQREAAHSSILIEPGDVYFHQELPPLNYFRLGTASIPAERIKTGVRKLAALI